MDIIISNGAKYYTTNTFNSCKGYREAQGIYSTTESKTRDNGLYWITSTIRAYCDMDNGGWTMIVGNENPTNLSSWFSDYASYSNSKISAISCDTCQDDIILSHNNVPFVYTEAKYSANGWSSGGSTTGQNHFASDSGNVYYVNGCGTQYVNDKTIVNLSNTDIRWSSWSDGWNACGGSGAELNVTRLLVK